MLRLAYCDALFHRGGITAVLLLAVSDQRIIGDLVGQTGHGAGNGAAYNDPAVAHAHVFHRCVHIARHDAYHGLAGRGFHGDVVQIDVLDTGILVRPRTVPVIFAYYAEHAGDCGVRFGIPYHQFSALLGGLAFLDGEFIEIIGRRAVGNGDVGDGHAIALKVADKGELRRADGRDRPAFHIQGTHIIHLGDAVADQAVAAVAQFKVNHFVIEVAQVLQPGEVIEMGRGMDDKGIIRGAGAMLEVVGTDGSLDVRRAEVGGIFTVPCERRRSRNHRNHQADCRHGQNQLFQKGSNRH